MKLEIIATSLNDALKIKEGNADRIELVSNINEGGLTPNIKTIIEVTEAVDIPVYVMLRPHSKSFVYSEEDVKIIFKSLEQIKKTKAKGIVFGALTDANLIDEKLLKAVIDKKEHLKLTFHRAIDSSNNPLKALKVLIKYDIERILTSGGKDNAIEGFKTIKKMTKIANKENISILAGGGLTLGNVGKLIQTGKINEIHLGSGVRINKDNNNDIDPEAIKEIKDLFAKS